MSPNLASDHASFLALQQGEASALNRLIERWQRPLLHFAYRYVQNHTDAHDLVAETFVKLYQQRDRLRPDTKLSAWMFTTLANLCHNHQRWKRRHPTVALFADADDPAGADRQWVPAEPASDLPSPEMVAESNETQAAVRAAIDRLPHELKTTLLLHHYEQLSYREIAEISHCSERGVETRLYRARQQLRVLLTDFLKNPARGVES